jgi:hypothetical protein
VGRVGVRKQGVGEVGAGRLSRKQTAVSASIHVVRRPSWLSLGQWRELRTCIPSIRGLSTEISAVPFFAAIGTRPDRRGIGAGPRAVRVSIRCSRFELELVGFDLDWAL